MFTVVITEKGGAQRRMDFDKSEVTIGRVQGNDIILPKGNVSKRHSRIVLKDKRFIVVDLKSTNGTYVNGRKITSPLVVKPGDKIYIGDFIMAVEGQVLEADAGDAAPEAEAVSPSAPPPLPPSQPSPSAQPVAAPPPMAPPPPSAAPAPEPPPPSEVAPAPTAPPLQPAPAPHGTGAEGPSYVPPPVGGPMPQAQQPTAPPSPAAAAPVSAPPRATLAPQALGPAQSDEAALRMLMSQLATRFDIANVDALALSSQERWNEAQALIQESMDLLSASLGSADREALGAAALREAVGLGPLEELLANDSIQEIVVEGHQRILADAGDGLKPIAPRFSSNFAVMVVAQRLCAQGDAQFNPGAPIQHATLPYGPHVTVVLPPVAVRGPIIEVRRMGSAAKLEDLTKRGVIDESISKILRAALSNRRNVLVAGPIDSGVTQLIGALASSLNSDTRVATVENAPELMVDGPQVLSLSSGEPLSGLSLSEVAGEACMLRVDWLVVDDARGGSARGVLEAVRCRKAGNIVGLRAGAGQRVEDTIHSQLRLNGENDSAIKQLLSDAVDVVVQLDLDGQGSSRAVRVAELTGPGESLDLIVYDGSFQSTGAQPSFQ